MPWPLSSKDKESRRRALEPPLRAPIDKEADEPWTAVRAQTPASAAEVEAWLARADVRGREIVWQEDDDGAGAWGDEGTPPPDLEGVAVGVEELELLGEARSPMASPQLPPKAMVVPKGGSKAMPILAQTLAAVEALERMGAGVDAGGGGQGGGVAGAVSRDGPEQLSSSRVEAVLEGRLGARGEEGGAEAPAVATQVGVEVLAPSSSNTSSIGSSGVPRGDSAAPGPSPDAAAAAAAATALPLPPSSKLAMGSFLREEQRDGSSETAAGPLTPERGDLRVPWPGEPSNEGGSSITFRTEGGAAAGDMGRGEGESASESGLRSASGGEATAAEGVGAEGRGGEEAGGVDGGAGDVARGAGAGAGAELKETSVELVRSPERSNADAAVLGGVSARAHAVGVGPPAPQLVLKMPRGRDSPLGSKEDEASGSGRAGPSRLKPGASLEEQVVALRAEMDTMKERFAKLLLGEDMSGMGTGVSNALTISNAITNLAVAVFGQLWRLEALSEGRKEKWRREMDWLTCIANYMVELVPAVTTAADGTVTEVMVCQQRKTLHDQLQALRKLDNMLLATLDALGENCEFWYTARNDIPLRQDVVPSLPNSATLSSASPGSPSKRRNNNNTRLSPEPNHLRSMSSSSKGGSTASGGEAGAAAGGGAVTPGKGGVGRPQVLSALSLPHEEVDMLAATSGPSKATPNGRSHGVSNGNTPTSTLSQRQTERWWLPEPRVPPGGLSDAGRKLLKRQHACASQILKASLAINSLVLAEIEIPDAYLQQLPKNPKAALGGFLYHHVTKEEFEPDRILRLFDLSREHVSIEAANRLESATHLWRIRIHLGEASQNRGIFGNAFGNEHNRSPDHMVIPYTAAPVTRELTTTEERWEMLAQRAELLLMMLRQKCPRLRQTTLESCKIQYSKDIGLSILESYSRVLESLSSNIVACIEDVLHVDGVTRGTWANLSTPGSDTSSGVGVPFTNGQAHGDPSSSGHPGASGQHRMIWGPGGRGGGGGWGHVGEGRSGEGRAGLLSDPNSPRSMMVQTPRGALQTPDASSLPATPRSRVSEDEQAGSPMSPLDRRHLENAITMLRSQHAQLGSSTGIKGLTKKVKTFFRARSSTGELREGDLGFGVDVEQTEADDVLGAFMGSRTRRASLDSSITTGRARARLYTFENEH